jgi:hypothetical protein
MQFFIDFIFFSSERLTYSKYSNIDRLKLVLVMEDESGYYVNEVDGLPNEHPALPESTGDELENVEPDTLDDLPTSLIVTNIHTEVFHSEELKAEMENVFKEISDNVTFQWLKSFRRLRVNFETALAAGVYITMYNYNQSFE